MGVVQKYWAFSVCICLRPAVWFDAQKHPDGRVEIEAGSPGANGASARGVTELRGQSVVQSIQSERLQCIQLQGCGLSMGAPMMRTPSRPL